MNPHLHLSLSLSNSEQCKIATFLTLIDRKIELLTKIIDCFIKIKKYLLNNLFVNQNNKTPLIRFPGFEGEWEEKYLSEFLIESNIKNKENKNIPVFSVSNQGFVLQQEYFKSHELASKIKNNYKIVTKNTFAYNPARINIGSIALFNHDIGQVSPIYVVFTTKKIINDYLNFYFHSTLFKKQIINNLEGSVRKVINFKKIILFKIYVPLIDSYLSEQTKISDFLTLINQKIENIQQQKEKIIQIKKYLLNKMFVND